MGDEASGLWPDPAAVRLWQGLLVEAARIIGDRVGVTLETSITRQGNVLWGRLGDLDLRLAPPEVADVSPAAFPDAAAHWAQVRHPNHADELTTLLADMMSHATAQPSEPASAGIVWPQATPQRLLDVLANGDGALDALLRSGLHHLGSRTTPAADGTYRFLLTHWFKLPELMATASFTGSQGADLMSRCLIAIMLARGQHLDAWGGLAKDAPSFSVGDVEHGPWRAQLITADTYEPLMPDAVRLLIERWTMQEYEVPLPNHVVPVLEETYRALARSVACFRLPQLPEQAQTRMSAYGSYLELIFVDLVTRELGLVVLSDD